MNKKDSLFDNFFGLFVAVLIHLTVVLVIIYNTSDAIKMEPKPLDEVKISLIKHQPSQAQEQKQSTQPTPKATPKSEPTPKITPTPTPKATPTQNPTPATSKSDVAPVNNSTPTNSDTSNVSKSVDSNISKSIKPVSVDISVACHKQVQPEMPAQAITDGVAGVVRAKATIKNGKVLDVQILSGNKVFHKSVISAMKKYQCSNDQENVVEATQQFTFKVE